MKAIVCEMCNGNNVIKQGDFYVCQSCGTKYEPETAKKLMVEFDNSKKINNLRERARRSLEVDDLKHAAEYFKEILDDNPDDWEAYLYSYLGESASFTNKEAGTVARKIGSTVPTAYDMAIKAASNDEELTDYFNIITDATIKRLSYIFSTAKSMVRQYEGGNLLTPTGKVQHDMFINLWGSCVQNTIEKIAGAFRALDKKLVALSGNNDSEIEEPCKSCLLKLRKAEFDIATTTFAASNSVNTHAYNDAYIKKCAENIKELEPDFKIPDMSSKSQSSGGCYVATAVYGSYDCPQVWTLRRYRDYELAETRRGRAFIRAYYAISPTLVKWFGKTEWFKKMWRGRLDSLVAKCQKKGYSDTPYKDCTW